MIKGVNHKVVEVTDTQNDFFERILFFVKSEHADTSEGKLREEAQIIVDVAEEPPQTRRKNSRVKSFLKYSAAAFAGALFTLLITLVK